MNKNLKKILIPTVLTSIALFGAVVFSYRGFVKYPDIQNSPEKSVATVSPVSSTIKTDAEWKQILTSEQYHILREAGTEVPFTGKLEYEHRKGTYYSAGCNQPIFRSEQKYDSGTGWPSFWNPINTEALVLREERSMFGGSRIEVLDKCGGHLGHVFDDGPQPTGKRYCMNSGAMFFVPDPQ